VYDGEVAAVTLDDSLGQYARILAALVRQVADDDLWVDGRCFCHRGLAPRQSGRSGATGFRRERVSS
jgi:hypothetical protein